MNLYPKSMSADLNYYLRTVTESGDDDLLFAFYLGASGNTSPHTYVEGTKKYPNYGKMGVALAGLMLDAMDSLERVEAGKINVCVADFDAKIRKDDATVVEKAKEVQEKTKTLVVDSDEYYAVLEEYGFESKYDVRSVISRNEESGEYQSIRLTSLSFGDIGLVGVPYEMFDTNGIEVRDGSPFRMTLVLTACGGAYAYVPSALAVPNGGYQVYKSPFEYGTAEDVVSELLSMLCQHREIK